jgi:integrase/recombinase XerD
MTRRQENHLLSLVQSFFLDHLQRICGASPHTVRAYRDTLRLLFIFLAQTKGRSVADLQLDDLHVDAVMAFLTQLEAKRRNTAATRNYRLAAIKSFCKHLIRHDLVHAEQYHRVLAMPAKRTKPALAFYLEPEDVRRILAKPDRATALGVVITRCYCSATTRVHA